MRLSLLTIEFGPLFTFELLAFCRFYRNHSALVSIELLHGKLLRLDLCYFTIYYK